jgi:hypothetical protein
MDPLSDLLRVVRLDGAYFYAVEAAAPWSVETAPARELTPRIMPAAEHLISYHIVTDGHCYGGLVGEDPVELVRGDAIVFPQEQSGDVFCLVEAPTKEAAIRVQEAHGLLADEIVEVEEGS